MTMGKLGKVLIGIAALGGLLAWTTNFRTPQGFQEPGKLRMFMTFIQFTFKLGDTLEYLGFSRPMFLPVDPESLTLPDSMQREETRLAGVRTVIYRPKGSTEDLPAIIFYHGGAWIMGSPELIHEYTVDLVKDLGVAVISVDYRLAPLNPYPTPFGDCYRVTEYVINNAKELKVDPRRISIGGDSAGGNLAAAVATKFRDEGKSNKIKMMLLLYPVLQPIDFQTQSYEVNADDGLLSRDLMIKGWVLYALGREPREVIADMRENAHVPDQMKKEFNKLCGNSDVLTKTATKPTNSKTWNQLKPFLEDPYYAPLVAKDLTNMPPAIVVTMEQDILKDDGFLYVQRLRESGVKVVHHHNENSLHGIFTFKPTVPIDYKKAYDQVFPDIRKLV